MNYGKLAYQQAADLSARLNYLETRESGAYRSAGFTQEINAQITEAFAMQELVLQLPGNTSLYVELAVTGRLAAEGGFRVDIYLNGALLNASVSAFSAGDFSTERRLTVAAAPKGKAVFSVVITPEAGGVTLRSASLTAFGTGIAESAATSIIDADVSGENLCVAALSQGGKLTVTAGVTTRIFPGAAAFSVRYLSENGGQLRLLLALVDERRTLTFLVMTADTLQTVRTCYGDSNVTDIGMASGGGAFPLTAAYVKGGAVYVLRAALSNQALTLAPGRRENYRLPAVLCARPVTGGAGARAVLAATGGGVCYAFLYPSAHRSGERDTLNHRGVPVNSVCLEEGVHDRAAQYHNG